MVIENKNIEIIDLQYFEGENNCHLVNCIITTIDLIGTFDIKVHLVIENCIVDYLKIHSCWFTNGLVIKNCIINNNIDYQMGGHNLEPLIIEGNIFIGFFNFFDCQFENRIELKNNIFVKGTNLLGNIGEGFENTFNRGYLIENNKGDIDVNEVDV